MTKVPRVFGFSCLFTKKLIKNPVEYLTHLRKTYGDIFCKKFLGHTHYFLSHPEYAEHIFTGNQDNYRSDPIINYFNPILTTHTNAHSQEYNLINNVLDPAVYFEKYTAVITQHTTKMLNNWQHKMKKNSATIPIAQELNSLTTNILNSTIFYNTKIESALLSQQIPEIFNLATQKSTLCAFLTNKNRRYAKAIKQLEDKCKKEVITRLQAGKEYDDLLGMLLHSYQIKDENSPNLMSVINNYLKINIINQIIITTTLRWLFIILAQHPKIAHNMSAEIFEICHGKAPKYTDYNYLKYTRAVINEVLRLHPPSLFILRQAISKDNILGYTIPANTGVAINTYLLHRHPLYWKEPDKFNPERFLKKPFGQDYPYAYLPFGSNSQSYLWKNFALLEICLIAAMVMQRFQFALPQDFQPQTEYLSFLFQSPRLDSILISNPNSTS